MSTKPTNFLECIPGILAYSIGAYICTASRVFIWKIASHWSKIWVANANQGDSQILALTFVITLLLVTLITNLPKRAFWQMARLG
jgi:hypothetical protein